MFYIYILHCSDGKLYTGYSHDLRKRIEEHRKGRVFSTKSRLPFTLIHYEMFVEESDAKKREMYLKDGNGKKEIAVLLESYFKKHEWIKNEFVEDIDPPEKPGNAVICGVCNGVGKAATQSFFKYGKRYSGHLQICLTCKGKGWLTQKDIDKAKGNLEI
jgi:putative endonuclease